MAEVEVKPNEANIKVQNEGSSSLAIVASVQANFIGFQSASSLGLAAPAQTSNMTFQQAKTTGGPLGTLAVLPPEVRNMIYVYVLNFNGTIRSYLTRDEDKFTEKDRVSTKSRAELAGARIGILTVSKLIHNEAFPVIFTSNMVHLTTRKPGYPTVLDLPWKLKNRSYLEVVIGKRVVPSRLRKSISLVKHWSILIRHVHASALIFQFLHKYARRYLLDVKIKLDLANSDPDQRRLNLVMDRLTTLRGASRVSFQEIEYSTEEIDWLDLTPEFETYISNTLKLPKGRKAESFGGIRYIIGFNEGSLYDSLEDDYMEEFDYAHDDWADLL